MLFQIVEAKMGLEIKKMLESIESMANQRRLDQSVVIDAVESALAFVFEKGDKVDAAGESRGCRYRVSIDQETGDYESFRYWSVITDDDYAALKDQVISGESEDACIGFIGLSKAREMDSAVEVGNVFEEQFATEPLGRIAAQQAKQFILQRMRDAERAVICQEHESKLNQLLVGQVKRVTRDSLIVDFGNGAEGLLMRSDMIPRENFRLGDRIRVVLYGLNEEKRGPQLLISRKHPQLVIELFKMEVPEINEEVIEIINAVRDAGSRAKIAVKTNDGRIDPVGACVGMRGSRVQAVTNELAGERVDIILWDDNPAQLVIKAMSPAEVSSIVVDEDKHSMDVIVEDSQLSLAIGRGGQNVRLASELTGWELNILSKEDAQKKQDDELKKIISELVEKLSIDENVAEALVNKGLTTIEEIAYAEPELLLQVNGIDEALLDVILQNAGDILLAQELLGDEEESDNNLSLSTLSGMNDSWIPILIEQGISDRDDLGDLAVDELQEIIDIDGQAAAELIMKAREHWFADNRAIVEE